MPLALLIPLPHLGLAHPLPPFEQGVVVWASLFSLFVGGALVWVAVWMRRREE